MTLKIPDNAPVAIRLVETLAEVFSQAPTNGIGELAENGSLTIAEFQAIQERTHEAIYRERDRIISEIIAAT